MPSPYPLTAEEIECILYDSREGDLATIKAVFEEIGSHSLEAVIDSDTHNTPLHMASANGHDEVVKYLLEIAPSGYVGLQNASGNTALHWAAFNGHVAVVQMLLDAGADASVKNASGHDALHEAERNNHEDVATCLLKTYKIEDEFKVEETEGGAKITYVEGTESREADERAREGMEKLKIDLEK